MSEIPQKIPLWCVGEEKNVKSQSPEPSKHSLTSYLVLWALWARKCRFQDAQQNLADSMIAMIFEARLLDGLYRGDTEECILDPVPLDNVLSAPTIDPFSVKSVPRSIRLNQSIPCGSWRRALN